MNIIGSKNKVVIPQIYLTVKGGSSRFSVSGITCSIAMGSIPVCGLQIPPETLELIRDIGSDTQFQISVGMKDGPQTTIFTGYLAGESMNISGSNISSGIDLVHPARDLDEVRMWSPDLHAGGVADFTNFLRRKDTTAGSSQSPDGLLGASPFYTGGNVGKEILQNTAAALQRTQQSSAGLFVPNAPKSLAAAADLLQRIHLVQGHGDFGNGIGPLLKKSISSWAKGQIFGSSQTLSSVWDSLSRVFAAFQLYFRCLPDGTIALQADTTGLAPGGNFLDSDYITSIDMSGRIVRNINQIRLLSHNIHYASATGGGIDGVIAVYPPNPTEVTGAAMCQILPGWLDPLSVSGGGATQQARAFQVAYAKSLYFNERDKLKTAAITGPLAPGAFPGTTTLFSPYSSMKTFSGGNISALKKSYTGYCYQVNHFIDARLKACQTTFLLRNISDNFSQEVWSQTNPLYPGVKPADWS